MDIQTHIPAAPSGAGASGAKNLRDAKLRQTCQDLESVFTGYLLKSMRSTVQKSDLFGGDQKEDMFQDMLDDEMARASSKQKGTGLAEMLYRQLSELDKIQQTEKPLKAEGQSVDK